MRSRDTDCDAYAGRCILSPSSLPGLVLLRIGLIAVAMLCVSQSIAAQETCVGQPNALAPDQLAQFDFLLGTHEVTLHAWLGEKWSPARPGHAQWRGWHGLDGYAVYDEWIDPDPTRGSHGVNVRMYDPDEGLWKMMWISTRGKNIQDLRAQMRDGVMTMWNVDRTGWKAEFEILNNTAWARADYQQDEAGNWVPQFRLVATRRTCDRAG